ncbi:hypothetical protein [Kordiimonas aestuarii]|uniref:hypothetical protein n=1 Tax=Kordiimonas aestuarii TaxID=1005925 RepID=UPI0021CE35C3|nr:hypothetical protein [Kordiimonas aestuarii]
MRKTLLIAVMGISLGATAAPSREETVAYIQKQCNGTPTGSGAVTSNVRVKGTVLTFTEGVPVDASAKGDVAFWQEQRSLDLKDATLKEDSIPVQFACSYDCVSVEGFYLGSDGRKTKPAWGNKPGTNVYPFTTMHCRNPERVLNAVQHLQSFITDDDPFAN